MDGENGIAEQGKVLPGTLGHVKLDGECDPRSNRRGEDGGLLRMSQQPARGAFSEPGSSSGGALAPPCRRAGRRPRPLEGCCRLG